MIKGTGVGYSQGTSHQQSFYCYNVMRILSPFIMLFVKNEDLTPFVFPFVFRIDIFFKDD